jgi:hypothetical protein
VRDRDEIARNGASVCRLQVTSTKTNRRAPSTNDDDLIAINGKREQLEGKIQERYGVAKDQARKQVDDWYASQSF